MPDGTNEEMVMNSKLTLPKETLHALSTHTRRDGAALATKPTARTGANDPKPPSSFTTLWTQPW